MSTTAPLSLGIDIGGTFTDFALLKGGEVILHKNLSTPQDRSLGVMEGLGRLAEIEGLPLGDFLGRCEAIVHGTTIADNTLIEMNGALTGLITRNFDDQLGYMLTAMVGSAEIALSEARSNDGSLARSSARASSSVLPRISASVCARQFASSSRW